ncbi:MAG TPA: hypothetical protein DIT30_05250 [Verrucomicrobiales bacterium]|nr:hypothetical protein [Verrucomicrobiales bacterium]
MTRRPILISLTALTALALALPSIPLHLLLFVANLPTSFSSASWRGIGELEIRGIQHGSALRIKAVTIRFDPTLFRGQLAEVRLYGAEGWLSRLENSQSTGQSLPLRIHRLMVADSTLQLDNLGPGIPTTPLRLGDTTPLLFTDVHFGPNAKSDSPTVQSATIERLIFYSPNDPLAPVLAFPKIDIVFTWDELLHHHIRSLIISNPTIYLGDDLFAFVDRVQEKKTTPSPSSTPYEIGYFSLTDGDLSVSIYGQPVLPLPVHFAAEQRNLALSDFTQLQLSTRFTIPPSDLKYPDYDLSVLNLRGNLYFSLGQDSQGKRAKNVVPTLFADQITFRKLTAENLSIAVTVNPQGIYGRASALLGGGSLDGGFSLEFLSDLPWSAWSSTSKMESRVITDALTPGSFQLQSKVDALVSVNAQGKNIRGGYGTISFREGGRLQIPALRAAADRIPKDWSWIKQGSARAALEVIRNYGFAEGEIRAVYQPPAGRLTLNLRGPEGKRDITLNWLPPGS